MTATSPAPAAPCCTMHPKWMARWMDGSEMTDNARRKRRPTPKLDATIIYLSLLYASGSGHQRALHRPEVIFHWVV